MTTNSTAFHAIPRLFHAENSPQSLYSTDSTPKRVRAHVYTNMQVASRTHIFTRACTNTPCTPWNQWNTGVTEAFSEMHGVEWRGNRRNTQ